MFCSACFSLQKLCKKRTSGERVDKERSELPEGMKQMDLVSVMYDIHASTRARGERQFLLHEGGRSVPAEKLPILQHRCISRIIVLIGMRIVFTIIRIGGIDTAKSRDCKYRMIQGIRQAAVQAQVALRCTHSGRRVARSEASIADARSAVNCGAALAMMTSQRRRYPSEPSTSLI